ncbi:wall-associated receptor kinase-like 14 [Camellia sinensis]|uniref:Protein kinase domain-containing protein n=1 Tax=Camellia sinensis var. sinensis TaxID=542762 RepID=A0A4S4DXM5_CAMSN|nr:wall-associated receptor kinase-like 14 [Camellia sinensis]THG08132.1 hypothetical protein TEA_024948 [Camellia sinensis var. sinensis]
MIKTILFFAFIAPAIVAHSPANCSRSCGGAPPYFPFPFGFSAGCPIQLQCTANGTAVIDGFPVQTVTSDTILINLPAQCNRPIQFLGGLFTQNYAPTSKNGILLQNCTSPITACVIPTTMVQTHFELLDCGSRKKNNISCYSEQNKENEFINYSNVKSQGCESLFSAISVSSMGNSSAVSLDVQVVQLGWWLDGDCMCSGNANCTNVSSPTDGGRGYRCQCLDGFVGDGYRDGLGCRKDSSACNPAKYMSGECGSTTRVGVLVGGIAAGASLMVSVGLACCFIRKRSKLNHKKRAERRLYESSGICIPIYPYKEIERATNFFSDKQQLGTGAYGTVYAGKLNNDEWVAIKRIKQRDTDSIEQVMNEIKLLSSVSHPNLVRLLGCCVEKSEQILVYEFMPNGTLSHHLHEDRSNGLSWPVRLTIAMETAQAIAFLHSSMNPPIYHRDIKSSNILLDHNFKSKVADFGLSRLGMTESSHISTAPQGTPGYLDPQYHQNYHLSDKSDVYSFGVVLVEIITALKAVDFNRSQNEVNLASLAVDRIAKGKLDEIIDPLLEAQTDAWTLSSVHKVAELAFRCLAYDRDTRPSMIEVAIELEQTGLSRWASSEGNVIVSSNASSYSSSSNISEKPLGVTLKKPELDDRGLFARQFRANSVKSIDGMKDFSPVSVQDHWLSEESSPSSSSLLSNVAQ